MKRMKLTRKQWFGLITLIVLLIASYLVTTEPWKKSSGNRDSEESRQEERHKNR